MKYQQQANDLIAHCKSGNLSGVTATINEVLRAETPTRRVRKLFLPSKSIAFSEFINFNNNEALKAAIEFGHFDIFNSLLQHKAVTTNINAHIAVYAIKYKRTAILRRLLDFKSVSSNISQNENECLRLAAELGNVEDVKILLEYQVVSEFVTAKNNEAIRLAIQNNHSAVITVLLEYPAVLSYAEQELEYSIHVREFVNYYTENLFSKMRDFTPQRINAVFDLTDARHIATTYQILRSLIKIQPQTDTRQTAIIQLLCIPAISKIASVDRELLDLACDNKNESLISTLLEYPQIFSYALDWNNACDKYIWGHHDKYEKSINSFVNKYLIRLKSSILNFTKQSADEEFDLESEQSINLAYLVLKKLVKACGRYNKDPIEDIKLILKIPSIVKLAASNDNELLMFSARYESAALLDALLEVKEIRKNIAANNLEYLHTALVYNNNISAAKFIECYVSDKADLYEQKLQPEQMKFHERMSYIEREQAALCRAIKRQYNESLNFYLRIDEDLNLDLDTIGIEPAKLTLIDDLYNTLSQKNNVGFCLSDATSIRTAYLLIMSYLKIEEKWPYVCKNEPMAILKLLDAPLIRDIVHQEENKLLVSSIRDKMHHDVAQKLFECPNVFSCITEGNVETMYRYLSEYYRKMRDDKPSQAIARVLITHPKMFFYMLNSDEDSNYKYRECLSNYVDYLMRKIDTADFKDADTVKNYFITLKYFSKHLQVGDQVKVMRLLREFPTCEQEIREFHGCERDHSVFTNLLHKAASLECVDIVNKLLNMPQIFAYAESHVNEYQKHVSPFIISYISNVRKQAAQFEATHATEKFNLNDPKDVEMCYLIVRNLIRTCSSNNDNLVVLMELLNIPSVATLVASNDNELLKLALIASQNLIANFLMEFPEVLELARQNNYYESLLNGSTVNLAEIARNRESSMEALNEQQRNILTNLEERYAKTLKDKGGVTAVLQEFIEYLRNEYTNNPAKCGLNFSIHLPLEWSNLEDHNNTAARTAYYKHVVHTAYRFFLKPNPWLARDALYVAPIRNGAYSNFEALKPLIANLWLAVSDEAESSRFGIDHNARINAFINSIALINRAHNYDQAKINSKTRKEEEVDDLQGDKPSCFSGMRMRLFQSVLEHSSFNLTATKDVLEQELRVFVYGYYKNLLTKMELEALKQLEGKIDEAIAALHLAPNSNIPNIPVDKQQQ